MTPLLLVTGFLGAGKTTFVRRLLLDARARKLNVGVIVNEFGSVDVDGALLREAADSLTSVAGGCACCLGQEDFVEAIAEMGAAGFDALVVEASGLADPLVLLETLAAPELRACAQVAQLLCVADASNWNQTAGALGPLLRRQLALADAIVLNKIDLVEASALDGLKRKIAEIAPAARVETATEGEVWGASFWSFEPRQLRALPTEAAPHAHAHTVWVALPHPLQRAALERALDGLGAEVWRAKGLVRVRGHSGLQLVQLTGGDAGHRWHIAPFAPPFGAPEAELGLVFIGARLDGEALQRGIGALELNF